ncbi:hypothetical protein AAGW05_13255 [Arthrobacter sp. LAPM80]|uniref:hypothetical protein n=1 Tax=Arthrobacter sp. LAPM80 TaxID=3141788 RepID=UPI00398A9EAA
MRQLREAARRFIAKYIVAEDPYPELSRLDREDHLSPAARTPDVPGFEPGAGSSQFASGTDSLAA